LKRTKGEEAFGLETSSDIRACNLNISVRKVRKENTFFEFMKGRREKGKEVDF